MPINKVVFGSTVLIDLTNDSVNPDSLVTGITAHSKDGTRIVGLNPYEKAATDSTVLQQKDLIDSIRTALTGKGVPGDALPTQEKTITLTENGQTEVVPDTGYTLSKVTINVDVESSGETSTDFVNSIIDRSITSLSASDIAGLTTIGAYSFEMCNKMVTAELPDGVTTIGTNGFSVCSLLESIAIPDSVRTIGNYAFYNCPKLKAFTGNGVVTVNQHAFRACRAITTIDLGAVTSIGAQAFDTCSALESLYLRGSTVATLANVNALANTPIATGTGFIFVKSSLLAEYKSTTNWSTYAERIMAYDSGGSSGPSDNPK